MLSININKLTKLDYRSREAFRTLRTNIQFCGSDIKVVAITSCTPAEGKSSVSFNLAVSLAETGKRVIFIDADIRKSAIIGRYRINKSVKGLSHYLSGLEALDDVVYATNVDNLHMVFSGPTSPNPVELLESKYFSKMIETFRDRYDMIIIDTPPLGSVIDSAVIAKQCDGVAMVISAGSIGRKFVLEVIDQLKKSECKILGVVLNKVDFGDNKFYGKYYGRYYGKYYGNYGNEEKVVNSVDE